jgi:formylmethanofuran dehydrogenase subunit A
MKREGRLQVGTDADITITVFDPATVQDRAAYQTSVGVKYLLVNGAFNSER